MSYDIKDHICKLVEDACSQIGGVADSVQIFVGFSDGNGQFVTFDNGKGSFAERKTVVRDWLITQDQYVKTNADYQQRKNYGPEDE